MNKNIKAMCACGKHFAYDKETHDAFEFIIESNLIEGVESGEAVRDSYEAWKFALTQDKLTIKNILKIHKLVMENLNPRIAGRIRNVNVMVGGRKCPNSIVVHELFEEWVDNMPVILKDMTDTDKEVVCKEVHITFEHMHPFEDGNGRVGRIIYNWQRVKSGLPIHIIYDKDKYSYYDWFKELT